MIAPLRDPLLALRQACMVLEKEDFRGTLTLALDPNRWDEFRLSLHERGEWSRAVVAAVDRMVFHIGNCTAVVIRRG